MRRALLFMASISLLANGCAASQSVANHSISQNTAWERTAVRVDTFRVVDPARHRAIPLATYAPTARPTPAPRLKVALLNHGYGGTNTAYSFLAKNLVAHGYYVLSLQHELPATLHNDMWEGATLAQQREMNGFISKFLAE